MAEVPAAVLSRYPAASKQWSGLKSKAKKEKKKDGGKKLIRDCKFLSSFSKKQNDFDTSDTDDSDNSVPESAELKEFKETMKRISSLKPSYQASINTPVTMEKSRSASSDFETGVLFERSATYQSILDEEASRSHCHVSWDVPPEAGETRPSGGFEGVPSVITRSSLANPKDWSSVIDPTTGRTYWRNKTTRETTWTRPSKNIEDDDYQDGLVHVAKGMVRSLSQNGFDCTLNGCGAIDIDMPTDDHYALDGNSLTSTLDSTLDETLTLTRTLQDDFSFDERDSHNNTFDEEDDIDKDWFRKDYPFAELPPPVRDAAELLGYTEDMWNDSFPAPAHAPASDSIKWNDLTEMQKSAATILGYNERKWNKEKMHNGSDAEDEDEEQTRTEVILDEPTIYNEDDLNENDWSGLCWSGLCHLF